MPALLDEFRLHHLGHLKGHPRVARPTSPHMGDYIGSGQAFSVEFEYTLHPTKSRGGMVQTAGQVCAIDFYEVMWWESGLLLHPDDFERLEEKLVVAALEDAKEHGPELVGRAVETVELMSSSVSPVRSASMRQTAEGRSGPVGGGTHGGSIKELPKSDYVQISRTESESDFPDG